MRVKSQNIFVTYSICNTVPVKLISKYRCCCVLFLLILLVNRCPGKSKEDGLWKSIFYGDEHITKGRSMCLIHNKT